MHRIKNIARILALLLLTACIKSYDPQIESNSTAKYVISGRVTDVEGWQEVNVSLSSPIDDPNYIPVLGCQVTILDDRGNSFALDDYGFGSYKVWLAKDYLVPGTSYKVLVWTPEGDMIESTYDILIQGPPLDSVYYVLEDVPTSDPEIYLRGMQFYVDLRAEGYESRNYKWEVIETWEYHAAHPFEYYYDGGFHAIDPPDSSNIVCWSTSLVKNVFTISTKDLTQNAYPGYALQFVDGHTSRLGILYSILVKQLALTDEAYNYWEQLRIISNNQGGLYEQQPLAVKGNLANMTHPEKQVLGYFFAASESSRRLFYQNVEGLELDFSDFCDEEPLGRMGWKEFRYYDYPIYYYYNDQHALRILNKECIDCRTLGGSTTKPDFWPL
jgi:hypothetical protein